MNPKVIHCKSEEAVNGRNMRYVGRGTIFGNDWSHKTSTKAKYVVGTPEEAVAAFDEWINEPEQEWLREEAKRQLRGMTLTCWCVTKSKPNAPCHARILYRIANER